MQLHLTVCNCCNRELVDRIGLLVCTLSPALLRNKRATSHYMATTLPRSAPPNYDWPSHNLPFFKDHSAESTSSGFSLRMRIALMLLEIYVKCKSRRDCRNDYVNRLYLNWIQATISHWNCWRYLHLKGPQASGSHCFC